MPLGEQFKNTFYTDEAGNTRFYTRNKSAANEDRQDHVRGMDEHIGDAPNEEWRAPSYQGMLFDPHWGTGSRKDPSISDEERTATIHKALNMDDIEKFRRVGQPAHTHEFFHKETGEAVPYEALDSNDLYNIRQHPENTVYGKRPIVNPRMSVKRAIEQRDAVTAAALRSGIPHQVWEGINTNIEVKPMQGNTLGHFRPEENIVRLKEQKKTEKVPVAGPRVLPPATRGAPIANPNWRAQTAALGEVYDSWHHRRLFTEGITGHMEERGWNRVDRNPENMPRTPQQAVAPTYFDEHGGITSTPDDHHYLPEGHSANIFPGKGASTKDYIATPIKTVMQDPFTYRNKTLWYHLRHVAVPDETASSETPEEPTPQRFRTVTKGISVSTDTFTHELGHVRYPGIRDWGRSGNPDPIFEGVADGQRDRHGLNTERGNLYEEDLLPGGQGRRGDILNTGYTADSFRHPLHRAAYIASRVHSALSDSAGADLLRRTSPQDLGVPSNSERTSGDWRNDALQLSVGQMYHQHPHVREALAQEGGPVEAEAQLAHKVWAGRQTAATTVPHSTLFDL